MVEKLSFEMADGFVAGRIPPDENTRQSKRPGSGRSARSRGCDFAPKITEDLEFTRFPRSHWVRISVWGARIG